MGGAYSDGQGEQPAQSVWLNIYSYNGPQMGEPEDLKGAIVYLSSDASKFMTGSEIRVDGGYCIV